MNHIEAVQQCPAKKCTWSITYEFITTDTAHVEEALFEHIVNHKLKHLPKDIRNIIKNKVRLRNRKA